MMKIGDKEKAHRRVGCDAKIFLVDYFTSTLSFSS